MERIKSPWERPPSEPWLPPAYGDGQRLPGESGQGNRFITRPREANQ